MAKEFPWENCRGKSQWKEWEIQKVDEIQWYSNRTQTVEAGTKCIGVVKTYVKDPGCAKNA